jgi:sugar lactone lactonase YvrE
MARPVIEHVDPAAGVEGGEIIITCADFEPRSWRELQVSFDGVASRPESASSARIIAIVPPGPRGPVELRIQQAESASEAVGFHAAEKLAENLHPVANPAFDHDNGSVYTTLSGTRGQEVPVSVYKISPTGKTQSFLSDLMNPTGVAFDPEAQMFITSRYDGTVYRVSPFKEAEPFARNLGIATGIAFDAQGRMFVGDRSGSVYLVSDIGDATVFATLEPSMAAYHLAFGPDGALYVTGPTASSFDSVYRVAGDGTVTNFFTGLGRPQGLAFDASGSCYVVASYRGRRGVFRISPKGDEISMVVAGPSLVGLCFDDSGNAILASTREIYRVFVGVKPFWPF